MQYFVQKANKLINRFEHGPVLQICAKNQGEDFYSVIAEIQESQICDEHGTPESWAEKIVSALEKLDAGE